MDERIVRAMRIIESRINEDVDFAHVARAIGLSPSRFHHLFTDEAGCAPGAYLRRIRLDAAALRLRWTSDTVGQISISLGYVSQSSFSHAFVRRFGRTPARFRREFDKGLQEPTTVQGLGLIGVREIGAFRLLAKRYVGDLNEIRSFWSDFEANLPGDRRGWDREVFVGLLYDDPRMTAASEVRYDCCVTVADTFTEDAALSARRLHLISTRPGRYGCLAFSGHRDHVVTAYQRLCDHWAKNSRYTISDEPAIELHDRPRHLMPPENVRLTLMLPLQG